MDGREGRLVPVRAGPEPAGVAAAAERLEPRGLEDERDVGRARAPRREDARVEPIQERVRARGDVARREFRERRREVVRGVRHDDVIVDDDDELVAVRDVQQPPEQPELEPVAAPRREVVGQGRRQLAVGLLDDRAGETRGVRGKKTVAAFYRVGAPARPADRRDVQPVGDGRDEHAGPGRAARRRRAARLRGERERRPSRGERAVLRDRPRARRGARRAHATLRVPRRREHGRAARVVARAGDDGRRAELSREGVHGLLHGVRAAAVDDDGLAVDDEGQRARREARDARDGEGDDEAPHATPPVHQ